MRSLIVFCLLVFVTAASAQSDGSVTGSVSDTAGAPVAGASIQAKNVETSVGYDGKPDFSGVWYGPVPGGGGGAAGPELLAWAEALEKERADHNFKDTPSGRCLPFTVTPFNFLLNRVVQSRELLVTIIEYDIPGYRQIYLDGRGHPKDLDPSWTGHSVGTWDGDTLVIDTIGFNDKTWLGEAVPHDEKPHVTMRLWRPDLGHLEIETTFDDPGAFKKTWQMAKHIATLAPATEEIPEFICNENNQDVEHLIGK